jgi:hypothetical protein
MRDVKVFTMRTALVPLAALALAGCDVYKAAPGPLEHFQRSVDLDKSEMERVQLKMGAGKMVVEGGSPKLMEGDFAYDIPSWKPTVRYDATGFRGELLIEQPTRAQSTNNITYEWNIKLNDKVPLEFSANLGAGEARLNLGSLNLRSVRMEMGVGEVNLDLRGNPTHDFNVDIQGGVGQAEVHLPASVGIVASAMGGIGHIETRGLEQRDGKWVNAAHEHSPVTIHVSVQGGIGHIALIAE